MNNTPSHYTGNLQRPVKSVSWNTIVNSFLPALNAATGRTFALPTEAQWEFAVRSGNENQHYKCSGSDNIGNIMWYNGNSASQTYPVGQKQANELGIYDMSGNVLEFCSDIGMKIIVLNLRQIRRGILLVLPVLIEVVVTIILIHGSNIASG